MITFLTIIHVATVVLLVIAVLLQSGKGAEISATFGGSSQTVFGSSGGQNFFQKLTYGLAGVFMVTSLTLTILPGKTKKSVFEGFTPPPAPAAPANTAPASPGAGENVAKSESVPAAKTAQPKKVKTEAAPATSVPTTSEKK